MKKIREWAPWVKVTVGATGLAIGVTVMLLRIGASEATDLTGMPPVAVVNERFVAENFQDQDPIGQNVRVRQIETVRDAMDRQVAPTRFYLILVGAFAGLAVLLSAVGLYGVVAYLVSRQTREIGIRIALGARIGLIVRLVTVQGLYPALGGLVVGLVASLAFARVLASLLFEVRPNDPGVLVGVSVLVLLVSCIATLIPARRAIRIDPVRVMRTE